MLNWIKDNPIFFLLIFLAIAAPSLFVGAMRVIFYIVLGLILLALILGLVFRAKLVRIQRDMEEQMRGGNSSQSSGWGGFYRSQQGASRKAEDEGDVKIYTQQSASEKKISNDVGDYVEFEEVEKRD